MSVSTSRDPVETILDILAATTDSDWTAGGAKPRDIERYEATEYSRKQRRETSDAVYVWSPTPGSFTQQGANWGYIEDQVVQVEVWTPTSSGHANALVRDVRDICFEFSNDNFGSTEWQEITPGEEDDQRGQARAQGVDHYVEFVLVDLLALRDG